MTSSTSTTVTPSTTTSETTTASSTPTTTTVKASSFIDRSKSSVQQSSYERSKPQPKVLSIDKQKSAGSQGRVATMTSSPKQRSYSTGSSTVTENKNTEKKTHIIESKPSDKTTTVATTSTTTTPESTTASDNTTAKTVVILEKPASSSNTSSSKSDKNSTSTVKKGENDENTQPKEDSKSSVIYRRPSPIQKDRVRSHTLPEQPVLRQNTAVENNNSSSSPVKNNKITPSPTASPQRSKSLKPIGSKQSDNDGRPSWIAMAHRKTGVWNSNEDNSKEENVKETDGGETQVL